MSWDENWNTRWKKRQNERHLRGRCVEVASMFHGNVLPFKERSRTLNDVIVGETEDASADVVL